MSETTDPGAPQPEPTPAPTPSAESTAAPESDSARDTTEAPEQQETEQQEGRRVAQLRARLGAKEREAERLAQENEYLRRASQGQPQAEETPEQRMHRIEAEADVRAEERLLKRRFHEEGSAEYPDWGKRCQDLMDMGADAAFARLLVDTPGGVRIAAALADDPTALERITSLQSERGRAVALGKYAATLNDNGRDAGSSRAAPVPVTRAPAPIRPVTGRASPSTNEYSMNANQLAELYAKRDMDNRLRR